MRSIPYRALSFLVAFLLLASPILAAAAGTPVHRAEAQGVLAELWQVVRQLVPALSKGRAGQDPNGSPLPDSTSSGATGEPETEGRAGQDPNG